MTFRQTWTKPAPAAALVTTHKPSRVWNGPRVVTGATLIPIAVVDFFKSEATALLPSQTMKAKT